MILHLQYFVELLIIFNCCRPPKQAISCGVGGCTNQKKYSCSKTGTPLCSLDCYKKNLLQNAAQIPIPATWWLILWPWPSYEGTVLLCWRWHSHWTATDRNLTIVRVMEAGDSRQSLTYSRCHTEGREWVVLVWVITLYCVLFMVYILKIKLLFFRSKISIVSPYFVFTALYSNPMM